MGKILEMVGYASQKDNMLLVLSGTYCY